MLDTQIGRVIIPTRAQAILSDVLDNVVETAGLAVVRGPVGIGKTFALRHEIERLEANGVLVIFMTSTPEIEGSIGAFMRATRGGSVCLNRPRAFSKWFSALVTPPPLRVSAG